MGDIGLPCRVALFRNLQASFYWFTVQNERGKMEFDIKASKENDLGRKEIPDLHQTGYSGSGKVQLCRHF